MSITKRTSFPIQWPDGWKRTPNRFRPKFHEGHFAVVRDSIIKQLNRMGGTHVVITSDLPGTPVPDVAPPPIGEEVPEEEEDPASEEAEVPPPPPLEEKPPLPPGAPPRRSPRLTGVK